MGHRPMPTHPIRSDEALEREKWDELDNADIETMTLENFLDQMAVQYEDWSDFVEWYERRQEHGDIQQEIVASH